jgi:hypothetical protein
MIPLFSPSRIGVVLIFAFLLSVSCTGGGGPVVELPEVPPEYAEKHMPQGWWIDPKVVEEGRAIYLGEVKIDVDCSNCHGKDGRPTRRGAVDFRASERTSRFSDSFWFWRVSEGVPRTKMAGWKDKLSEEQRWKVIAFEHTFSHGGKPSLHDDYKPK